jgi:hypothetical protein
VNHFFVFNEQIEDEGRIMNSTNLPPVLREINTLLIDIKRHQPGQIKELIKQRRRARIMRVIDAVLRRVGL